MRRALLGPVAGVTVEHLTLLALDHDAATELVRQGGVDLAVAGPLADRSGGNPFLLQQLVAAFHDDATTSAHAVPRPARDIVLRRVDRLGADGQDVLRLAAVVAAAFDFAMLREATAAASGSFAGRWSDPLQSDRGQVEDRLLTALERAVTAKLLDEVDVDRWQFRHSLVGDALLGALSPP